MLQLHVCRSNIILLNNWWTILQLQIYACSCIVFKLIIFFTPLQGKALIRPIAFRPTPGPNSGASTPTNGPLLGFRPPSNGPDSLHGLARASPATSQGGPFTPATNTNDGFAPGHPLVKDGRRHYGSKNYFFSLLQYSFTRFLIAYYVA